MKKRLLMQLMAVVFTVGAYALNVGEYIYSPSAKYAVDGANVFTGGDFTAGYEKVWLNEAGEALGNMWGVQTNVGPNGEAAMVSNEASSAEGAYLTHIQPLEPGLYTVSYWVKAESAIVTSIVNTATNYVHIFTNKTGDNTIETEIAGKASYTADWKQIVYTVNVTSADTYLVFNAFNVASGTMFANFEVYPVHEVFDTRKTDRLFEYADKLFAEPDFVNEKETFSAEIEFAKGAASDPSAMEDASTMGDVMTGLNAAIATYLDANAGNAVGVTADGVSTTRYLLDWATQGYSNWNNVSSKGAWIFDGGRWGFAPNVPDGTTDSGGNVRTSGDLERPLDDGYVASAGIQTSYTLDVGLHINPSAFEGTSLKAGKYMFSIEAQAVASANKSAPYGSNEGVEIKAPWIWVGADTLKLDNVVLNNTNWQRLYYIAEVKEGEQVTAGFHFPVVDGSTGGRYSLRNPEFRVVGKTQEQIDHLYAYDQLSVQKDALKERLDLANADVVKGIADGFPWGHAILQDSINKYQAVYDDLLTVVSADGAELTPERITLDYKDEILKAVQAMNSARNAYATTNRHYTTLISDVATCNESLNAENHANGDKPTFKAVIDASQAMIDAVQYDVDQTVEFYKQDSTMLVAKEVFEMGTATRVNPAELTFTLKNGGFEPWSSKSTYSSDRTVNGWTFHIGTDGKQWDVAPDGAYDSGRKASIWRGSSVGPNGKASQKFKLSKAGVYEYRAKAFATEAGDQCKPLEYMAVAKTPTVLDVVAFTNTPIDSVFIPNVRLFFGPDGNRNDSLVVSKCAPYDWGRAMTYSILFVKTDDVEADFELGLEALDNGATVGVNTFGFGDNHLYYLGDAAAYEAATNAALDEEIANAKKMIAPITPDIQNPGANPTDWLVYKLYRLMGDRANYPSQEEDDFADAGGKDYWYQNWMKLTAEKTLQEKQNTIITLQEYEKCLDEMLNPTGIDTPAVVEKVVSGNKAIYTIAGVRVQGDGKNLSRGLYIINGKKYVVK